jgi:hypothetical protein
VCAQRRQRQRGREGDQEPGDADHAATDAVSEPARQRHGQGRADTLADQQQAGVDGALTALDLKVQRDEDEAAEQGAAAEEADAQRGAERPVSPEPEVQQRS